MPHHFGNCEKCGTFRASLHKDHITPKFLARKLLGWSEEQIEEESNIQWLWRSNMSLHQWAKRKAWEEAYHEGQRDYRVWEKLYDEQLPPPIKPTIEDSQP